MTWLAIKLFAGGLLKRLWEAATALLGWAGRNPWQFAVIVLIALSGWLWRGNVSKNRQIVNMTAEHVKEIAKWQQASDANKAAAIAQVKATEAKFEKAAKETDDAHSKELAQAMSAADRYAAANRVRPERGSVRPAASPSEGSDSGVLEELPADAIVVSSADVRACTAATSYAVSSWKWVQSLKAAGLAQ